MRKKIFIFLATAFFISCSFFVFETALAARTITIGSSSEDMIDIKGKLNILGGVCITDDCRNDWGVSFWDNVDNNLFTASSIYDVNVLKGNLTANGALKIGSSTATSWIQATTTTIGLNSSAASRLGVWGNQSIGTSYLGSMAPANGLIVEGSVGIGVTNPGYKLHVKDVISGGREVLFAGETTDDATSGFYVINGTITNGEFRPGFLGYKAGDNNSPLTFYGQTTSTYDTGSDPLIRFTANRKAGDRINGTNSSIVTRPIVQFLNYNDPLMTILANGSVGIGTTTPDAKLSVNGSATFNTGAGLSIGNVGSYNKLITYSSAPVFRIFTGGGYSSFGSGSASLGASYAAISAPTNGLIVEGNVGVGTTAPGARLEVAGTVLLPTTANIQFGTTWNTGTLSFLNGPTASVIINVPSGKIQNNLGKYYTASSAVGQFGTQDNYGMSLVTNSVERLRIDTVGNVGIGMTNPLTKLHVNGSVTATGLCFGADCKTSWDAVGSFWSGSLTGNISNSNSGNVGIGTTNPEAKLGVVSLPASAYPDLSTNGSQTAGIANLLINTTHNPNNDRYFIDAKTLGAMNPGSKFRVDHNGRGYFSGEVGIGLTNPSDSLTVIGSISGTGALKISSSTANSWVSGNLGIGNATAGTSKLAVNGNQSIGSGYYSNQAPANGLIVEGNVGIGTTNPVQKLSISGTSVTGVTSQTNISAFVNNGMRINGSIGNSSQDAITYQSGGSGGGSAIAFGRGGNFDTFMSFYTSPSAGPSGAITERMRIVSDGNIGIGTTNPQARLDVRGSSLVVNNTSGTYYYRDVISIDNPSSSVTGSLKITMPKSWSNTMMTATIKGYNYSGHGAWEVVVGGYNHVGPSWVNTSVEIRGKAPFGSVRLAHDGTSNIILLGTTTTVWVYPKVSVTDFVAGHSNRDGWGSGWSMSFITDESGITNVNSPSSPIFVATSNNVGIGTTAPQSALHVQSTNTNNVPRGDIILGKYWASNSDTRASSLFHYYDSTQLMDKLVFGVAGTGGSNGQPNAIAQAKMVIQANGNVGIGMTNPSTKLHVDGSVTATGLCFGADCKTSWDAVGSFWSGSLTGNISNSNSGNVGIGLTNPSDKLSVIGNISGTGSLKIASSTVTSWIQATTTTIGLNSSASSRLGVWGNQSIGTGYLNSAAPANGLIVEGNVGIGTTAPATGSKLSVNGRLSVFKGTEFSFSDPATTDFIVSNSAANSRFLFGQNTGNYGGMVWNYNATAANAYLGIGINVSGTFNQSLIIGNTGNIGVGTTEPDGKLVITGSSDTMPVLRLAPNSNWGWNFYERATEGDLLIAAENNNVDTATLYLKRSNGNVGIGTNIPYGKLTVVGSSGLGRSVAIDNREIKFRGEGVAHFSIFGPDTGKSYLTIQNTSTSESPGTNGTDLLTILSGGNVGIGTTNPVQKFEVVGVAASSAIQSNISAFAGGGIRLSGGGANSQVGISYTAGGGGGAAIAFRRDGSWGTYMDFYTNNASVGGAISPVMTMNSAGSVGIGMTNPSTKLHVDGSVTATGFCFGADCKTSWDAVGSFWSGSLAGNIWSANLGSVGIGLTNPSDKLSVIGNISGTGSLRISSSTATNWISGGLGIGNATAGTSKLAVNGNQSIGSGYYSNQAPANGLIVEGNIGVGTTNPGYKLDVNGSARVAGTMTVESSVDQLFILKQLGISGTAGIKDGGWNYMAFLDSENDRQAYFGIDPSGNFVFNPEISGSRVITYSNLTISNNSFTQTGSFNNSFAGNLGIGITNPSTKLHVDGSVTATGLCFGTDCKTSWDAIGSFWSGSLAGNIWSANSGNVGIGLTNPSDKLSVIGSISGTGSLRISSSTATNWISGGLGIGNATAGTSKLAVSGNQSIGSNYYSNQAPADGLIVEGNVGIGTNNPGNRLTVSGSQRIVTDTGMGLLAYDQSSGGNYIFSLTRSNPNHNDLNIGTANGFAVSTGVTSIPSAGYDLYINSLGNVGIGTANPTGKLTVVGSGGDGRSVTIDNREIKFRGEGVAHFSIYGPDTGKPYLSIQSTGGTSLPGGSGTDVLVVTPDSRVGIGTTAPAEALDVASGWLKLSNVSGTGYGINFSQGGGNVATIIPNGGNSLIFNLLQGWGGFDFRGNSGSTLLKIFNQSGSVGIGTTAAPAAKLEVYSQDGVGQATLRITSNNTGQSGINTNSILSLWASEPDISYYGAGIGENINVTPSGGVVNSSRRGASARFFDGTTIFETYSTSGVRTEIMRISSNNNVGIGTTSPAYKLDVAGKVRATEFLYSSDRRLKNNIKTIQNPLNKILNLRGVTFNWNDGGEPSIGLIAQEVEKVFPELVSGADSKSVQYGNLVAPLIEAVKEQQRIIDNLEARITVLELKKK